MRRGLTLVEILMVTGVIAILAASSIPFMTRFIHWFYDSARSETAISQLYDTGTIVSRAITQNRSHLASFSLDANALAYDGKVLQNGVNASWNTLPAQGGVVIFNISTIAEPAESLRFVILPIR